MKGMEDGNFTEHRVLVRVDLDVPLTEGSSPDVLDDYRLRSLLPTINYLINRMAKVILIGHLGRPDGKQEKNLSLKPVYLRLSALLNRPIKFSPQLFSESTKKAVADLEGGEILGLENLRFDRGEDNNSRTFAAKLARYGEVYVNEAFACYHETASIVAITEFLPHFAGLHLEQEFKILSGLIRHPARPFIAIISGAKASDKLPTIEGLLPNVDRVLVGGRVANNFLAASGVDVKNSKIETSLIEKSRDLLKKAKGKIILPEDYLWDGDEILDVGPKTVRNYERYLKNAKTIIWSGPLGKIEDPRFEKSSKRLAEFVVNTKATTIVGGGNTIEMLDMFKLTDKFSFISTGGGASLELLSGSTLPGIKALN